VLDVAAEPGVGLFGGYVDRRPGELLVQRDVQSGRESSGASSTVLLCSDPNGVSDSIIAW
jgi:hypothetical protein